MDLRVFTEPQQGATYGQQVALARLAEELGFSAFFRSDHFLVMGDGDGRPGPTDAWLSLAAIARETTTIRLGTLVTSATFRAPAHLAMQVAQVDEMSGGRVELGLGAGWYEQEHTAHGFPFPALGERFERLEEQLAIITGFWSTKAGDKFSHAGKHYSLRDAPALPKPVQSPVPIVMGGYGAKRTPRLAATYAAEFNLPFSPVDYFAAGIGKVKGACETHGRDPESLTYSIATVACCGANEAEFLKRAENIGRDPAELRAVGAAGTPAEVVERLKAFGDAGAQRAYLQFLDFDDHDHLRLFASEVMPHLN